MGAVGSAETFQKNAITGKVQAGRGAESRGRASYLLDGSRGVECGSQMGELDFAGKGTVVDPGNVDALAPDRLENALSVVRKERDEVLLSIDHQIHPLSRPTLTDAGAIGILGEADALQNSGRVDFRRDVDTSRGRRLHFRAQLLQGFGEEIEERDGLGLPQHLDRPRHYLLAIANLIDPLVFLDPFQTRECAARLRKPSAVLICEAIDELIRRHRTAQTRLAFLDQYGSLLNQGVDGLVDVGSRLADALRDPVSRRSGRSGEIGVHLRLESGESDRGERADGVVSIHRSPGESDRGPAHRSGSTPARESTNRKSVTRFASAAALLLMVILGAGCSGEEQKAPSSLDRGRVLTAAGDRASIYEEEGLYTLRENRWSLCAWLDAAERGGSKAPRTLIHFGARSILGPSASTLPDLQEAVPDTNTDSRIERLSDDGFLFAAMAAGWVDTVYWVQPEISCYSGSVASVSFRLEEREGSIVPAVRTDSSGFDPVEMTRRAFSGEPVPRLFPIEVAIATPASDWESGPLQLYCMSPEQLKQRLESGEVLDRVWVDVDLDYFGSSLSIEKDGYLALSDESDFGVGMLGRGAPVFRDPPDSVRARAAAVAELIRSLAPEAVTIVESPGRSQGETLPEVESILRSEWIGPSGTVARTLVPAVSVGTGSRRVELQPECPILVDVVDHDSLRIAVRWPATPPERMEISLFFARRHESGRPIARWWTTADRPSVQVAVALPSSEGILKPGWIVEIRRLRDGALAFAGSFALDRQGASLSSLVIEQKETVDPSFPGVEVLREQSSPELILWGMRSRVPVGVLHEILLSHPSTLRSQCDDLRAHWIARTAVEGS